MTHFKAIQCDLVGFEENLDKVLTAYVMSDLVLTDKYNKLSMAD